MPTYTYRCTNCDHEFEARQRMTEAPLTACPVCEGKIRRVVNSVGVVFKGKGFYVTDNRGKTAQAPNSTSSKKEEGGAEKSAVSSSGGGEASSSTTSTSSSDSSRSGGGDATSKPSKTEKSSS
jgi:putative FmdB family regulatory protein